MDLSVLPGFLLAVAVLMAVPGTDMALLVATALAGGRRAAVWTAAGIATAVSLYAGLAAAGLAAVLAAAPGALVALRVLGAVYLAVLAWTTWRSRAPAGHPAAVPAPAAFRRGLLVNLSNPKMVLFFTAFFPQFLGDATGGTAAQMLMLGAVLVVVGLVGNVAIVLVADRLGRAFARGGGAPSTSVRGAAAAVYGTLAAVLLLDVALG